MMLHKTHDNKTENKDQNENLLNLGHKNMHIVTLSTLWIAKGPKKVR